MTPWSVVGSAAASTARDVLSLQAPANKYVAVHAVRVAPDADVDEHVVYELYKGTAATGTLLTPVMTDGLLRRDSYAVSAPHSDPGAARVGASAWLRPGYTGTARTLPTATKDADPFLRKGVPLVYGFDWSDDDGACCQLGPGEVLVVRQASTTSVTTSIQVDFEVL